jgi:hypothetical protein
VVLSIEGTLPFAVDDERPTGRGGSQEDGEYREVEKNLATYPRIDHRKSSMNDLTSRGTLP